MRRLAIIGAVSALVTLSGCEAISPYFTPTTHPDGTTNPSQFEQTLETAAQVSPAFGPAGLTASAVLGGVAGILELLRRRERKAKDRVADGLRVVAKAIDAVKTTSPESARAVVQEVQTRSLKRDRQVIDHVRGKTNDRQLDRAGV